MISKIRVGCIVGPLLVATTAAAQQLREDPDATVGYATVAEALQGLHARPDVVFSVQGGWTIVADDANRTLWSFSPEGYPAYPAVVKREIKPTGYGSDIKMTVLCEATKTACDQLVITFQKINKRIR